MTLVRKNRIKNGWIDLNSKCKTSVLRWLFFQSQKLLSFTSRKFLEAAIENMHCNLIPQNSCLPWLYFLAPFVTACLPHTPPFTTLHYRHTIFDWLVVPPRRSCNSCDWSVYDLSACIYCHSDPPKTALVKLGRLIEIYIYTVNSVHLFSSWINIQYMIVNK